MKWLKKLFGKAENAAGHAVGEVEDVIHHPILPANQFLWPTHHSIFVVSWQLSRGSWPSRNFLKALADCDYRVVVNLCSEREQDDTVISAGMGPVNIPIEDNTCPTAKQVEDFLTCMRLAIGKVYVHCEQGVGRTGCMVAAYRVSAQGWPVEAALAEAERFGLRMPCQKEFILNLKAVPHA